MRASRGRQRIYAPGLGLARPLRQVLQVRELVADALRERQALLREGVERQEGAVRQRLLQEVRLAQLGHV